MSSVIGQRDFAQKPTLKLRRRLKTLALGVSMGLPLLAAYPQTASVGARQGPPATKARDAYVPGDAAVDGARLPNLSSLDIASLIRDSDLRGAAMHSRLPEYTYIQKRLSRELDQRGKPVERVSAYDAYQVKVLGRQRHVISLISEGGAPVSPKRLKKERERAAKEIEEAERESALQAGGAITSNSERYVTAGIGVSRVGDGVWVGVSQFLRRCRFEAPRYERLADRYMIALDIRSCSGDSTDPRERYLAGMAGVVWIDAADRVVARLEAWPRPAETESEFPSAHRDAETIVYEQTRLPNGLWVPKRIRLNAIGRAAMFNGTDKDMIFEFSQYQRFDTEVEDLQRATLKSKP